MSPFAVRLALRRDVPELCVLWREMMAFHEARDPRFRFSQNADRDLERHLQQTITSRDGCLAVATADDRIVGYILGELHQRRPIYPAGTYGFVSDVSVTEPWRRRGIGSALVEHLFDWFRRRGVTAIELFVAEVNPVSMAFWRALGFVDFLKMLRLDLAPDGEMKQ